MTLFTFTTLRIRTGRWCLHSTLMCLLRTLHDEDFTASIDAFFVRPMMQQRSQLLFFPEKKRGNSYEWTHACTKNNRHSSHINRLEVDIRLAENMAHLAFRVWVLLCLRLCVVSEARNAHARSPPRVVQSSLQIEYIRALKPYESLTSINGLR